MTRHLIWVLTHGYYDSGTVKVMRAYTNAADAKRDHELVTEFGTERFELHEAELFGDVADLKPIVEAAIPDVMKWGKEPVWLRPR